MSTELSVVYRRTDELKVYERNPRTHDTAQVAQIAASIKRFGWTNPVLVDEHDRVIAGHGRLAAAKLLGHATTVPTICVAGLTDAERRALVIADNKLALNAGWDEALLASELQVLRVEDFDLGLIGFSADELSAMVLATTRIDDQRVDIIPAVSAEPVTHAGDVWFLGTHRLVCGDCTDATVVDLALQGKRADLCLTDPPYGLGETVSDKNEYDVFDDTVENLEKLISGFFPLAKKVADVIVLTPGNSNQRRYPAPSWTMAWFTPAGAGSGPWGFCCWQPMLCYGKDPKLVRGKGRHPDAIVHTESAEDLGHPCAKPIRFWTWLLERTSEPGGIIYEPFSGSGTTLVASELTGRICHAIELSPAYVDVAVKRWQDATGKLATHAQTGLTFAELSEERRVPVAG